MKSLTSRTRFMKALSTTWKILELSVLQKSHAKKSWLSKLGRALQRMILRIPKTFQLFPQRKRRGKAKMWNLRAKKVPGVPLMNPSAPRLVVWTVILAICWKRWKPSQFRTRYVRWRRSTPHRQPFCSFNKSPDLSRTTSTSNAADSDGETLDRRGLCSCNLRWTEIPGESCTRGGWRVWSNMHEKIRKVVDVATRRG